MLQHKIAWLREISKFDSYFEIIFKHLFYRKAIPIPYRFADFGAHTGRFIFCAAFNGLEVEESLSVEQNTPTYSTAKEKPKSQCRIKALNAGI